MGRPLRLAPQCLQNHAKPRDAGKLALPHHALTIECDYCVQIEFPNPNEAARLDILKIHSRKMNLTRGIDLKKIADKMTGGRSI